MKSPIAFTSNFSRRKCIICKNRDMSEWIEGCIKMTIELGEPKPSVMLVHRELKEAFPDLSPAHDNSTRRHLREHEPAWIDWIG